MPTRRILWQRGGALLLLWACGAAGCERQPPAPPAPLTLSASTLAVAWQVAAGVTDAQEAAVTISASAPAEVVATSSAPWLTVTPARGRTPLELKLAARLADLPAGTHTGQVLVAPAAGGTPLVLQATLTVAAPADPDDSFLRRRARGPISPDALARVKAATVLITSRFRPAGRPRARLADADFRDCNGTGFIISDDGLVATNNHVVAPVISAGEPELAPRDEFTALDAARHSTYILDSVTVRLASGTAETRVYPAQVVFAHPYPVDLAVVRFVPEPGTKLTKLRDLDPANRTNLANLPVDETYRVWAVGFPLGRFMEQNLEAFNMSANPNGPDISVREGVVTAVRHDADGAVKAIEHSCPIERGNSGGPLVDSAGDLIGVISLGSDKSMFAIPRETLLDTFFQTLAAHGYGNLFVNATARTLVVDASAAAPRTPVDRSKGERPKYEDTGGTFASIADAQKDSWMGDTILLSEGTYELTEPLLVYTGRRIRGAGIGKTIVRYVGKEEGRNYGVMAGGKMYAELSDLTIESPERCGLEIAEDAGPEISVHDVEVRAGNVALAVFQGARAQVTSCQLRGRVMVKGPGGAARLHRLAVDPTESGTASFWGAAFDVEGETAPSIEGCRIVQGTGGALRVTQKAAPRVRGCELAAFSGTAALEVIGAGGEYAGNWFWCPNYEPGARVGAGAEARLVGNVFVGKSSRLLEVIGTGARAFLSGNLLLSDGGLGVSVKEAGGAELVSNTFRFGRGLDLSAWVWEEAGKFPVAVAAELARPLLTPEQERAWEEERERQRARHAYGVVVEGAGSNATYRGNSFTAAGSGVAVRAKDGGTAEDGGGNTYPGSGTERAEGEGD